METWTCRRRLGEAGKRDWCPACRRHRACTRRAKALQRLATATPSTHQREQVAQPTQPAPVIPASPETIPETPERPPNQNPYLFPARPDPPPRQTRRTHDTDCGQRRRRRGCHAGPGQTATTILQLSCNGLRKHYTELRHRIAQISPHAVLLQETMISPDYCREACCA